MIEGIRIKNVRSILDSGMVELRPITLLVGRNSSGKSTFLRTLPLFKQSLAVDTKEPILWFSRQGVDFGSYKDALSRYAEHRSIEFSFLLSSLTKVTYEMIVTEFGEQILFHSGGQPLMLNEDATVELTSTLTQRPDAQGIYVSGITCKIGNDTLRLASSQEGLVQQAEFNGIRLKIASPTFTIVDKRGFFPRFAHTSDEQAQRFPRDRTGGPFMVSLIAELSDLFHGKTSAEKKKKVCSALRFGDSESFLSQLKTSFASTSSRLAKFGSHPQSLEKMRGQVLLCALPEMTRRAALSLRSFCKSIRYVEPVRARASRYYRYQELAIDEIDADGTNVPMFLYSLSEGERTELGAWLSEMLGFAVEANRSGDGHVELIVSEVGGGQRVNLADTGFGYSQVLPVALQLWKAGKGVATKKRLHSEEVIVAVEQPELHLHPEMQALVADVCVGSTLAARKSGKTLRLILETHSEHIVNRLGELVSAGRISTDDVVIYVFDREGADRPTKVRRVEYQSGGFLGEPWPFGFFVPTPLAS